MNRQWWVAQALTVSMLAGGGALVAGAPAFADAPAPAAVSADQPADQAALAKAAAAEEARNWVLKMAKSRLPAEVRTSAWNALRSSRGDEAIAEWMAPGGGYDAAKQRTRDVRTRNRAFCERTVATHTKEFSPEVRAAAERALKGTDADRAAFVKTGYAEAQKRDRVVREADAQHKREVAAKDRDFVRAIAEHDPGEQVRVAAQWALRPGAVDADVVEFYGYGWVTGGTLDLESYRMRVADAETLRHHTLSLLIKQAVAAEEAVKGAADAAKARAEAERAWKAVSEHSAAAQKAWEAEQAATTAQMENWQNIAKAAKESSDELWKNIAQPAEANQDTWAQEQAESLKSAEYWKAMFDQAQNGESRVKG
ncbi:ALF repeat-containing protein [Streptomyces sp. NPDC021096]|uniref:ALF repeat-containing protein n=1 Tax=Streptomyces sp. NPDC021096 TaxID=3154792 RepID=UPI00340E6977